MVKHDLSWNIWRRQC